MSLNDTKRVCCKKMWLHMAVQGQLETLLQQCKYSSKLLACHMLCDLHVRLSRQAPGASLNGELLSSKADGLYTKTVVPTETILPV